MSFNTIYGELDCPHCKSRILSGVGFRFGQLNQRQYKKGDELAWEGDQCRPPSRPDARVIKTLGHFNCDNIKCSSWQDCFPDIQTVLITIENNRITDVEIYKPSGDEEEFAILEPAELRGA
ncbi:MAG: hypothetical protein H6677_01005 [Candidatus Obscuribacterales bacterium]|nr:hypothetical protein [Cyanobacteria bacterium HKST-UBA01]MCB9466820.1 hypothetical protein [Candidatus Obscuribacterales bacterium]